MGRRYDQILSTFKSRVIWLTLATDPDGCTLTLVSLKGSGNSGVELIPFEEHVTFLYA